LSAALRVITSIRRLQNIPQFFCKFGLSERLLQNVILGYSADSSRLAVTGHEHHWHGRDEPRRSNSADSAVVVDHENARGRAGVALALVRRILGIP
jgi:hypothetical protein